MNEWIGEEANCRSREQESGRTRRRESETVDRIGADVREPEKQWTVNSGQWSERQGTREQGNKGTRERGNRRTES
jgi:hypothetical protein